MLHQSRMKAINHRTTRTTKTNRKGVTNRLILLFLLFYLIAIFVFPEPSRIPIQLPTSMLTIDDTNTATKRAGFIDSVIKKKYGSKKNTWELIELWVNTKVFTPDEHEKFNCKFVPFTSYSTGKSALMCVHNFHDIVSYSIRRAQRWSDCNILPELWNKSHATQTDESVYVEIGANIGSCVMEMLLGTNATIIAFEPHPMNVFNLKQTVMGLDKEYQDRLKLFPIGLGNTTETNIIYSARNNMGNSVVGKIIKDEQSQHFDENLQFQIYVEEMSNVLSSTADVKLMKMDAQGFECRILAGWGESMKDTVEIVKLEYALKWLSGQNCTDLLPRLEASGFNVYRHFKDDTFRMPISENPTSGQVFDIYAVNKKISLIE